MQLTLTMLSTLILGLVFQVYIPHPFWKKFFRDVTGIAGLGLLLALAWGLVASIWDHLP